jgi:hypothetical protein
MGFTEDFADVADQFAESFGEEATIARGDTASATATAQVWDRDYEIVDTNGVLTVTAGRDWLIHISVYLVDGEPVAPKEGDWLTDKLGDMFEVLPLGDRPAAELHFQHWLIHSKRLG